MLEYDKIDISEGIDTNIGILLIKILIIKNICVMVVLIYLQKL